MKNLKSLKKFKSEGLELNKVQQLKVAGGMAEGNEILSETSYMKPTNNNTECGDCSRYAKRDDGYREDPKVPFNRVIVAGVDAQDCHF